jgi:hypothetical protein
MSSSGRWEMGMAVRGCPVVVDVKGALKESGKCSL